MAIIRHTKILVCSACAASHTSVAERWLRSHIKTADFTLRRSRFLRATAEEPQSGSLKGLDVLKGSAQVVLLGFEVVAGLEVEPEPVGGAEVA